MLAIGIDISKASFDVAVLINDKYQNKHFNNDSQDFKALLKWLKPIKQDKVFCMEATGVYGMSLAKHLHQDNQKLMVVNPIKTNAFAKMEMTRNKTDKADAQMIERYCQYVIDKGELAQNLFTPKGKSYECLQYLVTRLEQLGKMRISENNRLQAALDKMLIRSSKCIIKILDKEIEKIEADINKAINQDETLKKTN